MARLSNLFGKRFGRLVVKNWIPASTMPGKWECLCDCGNTKYAITSHLKNGNIKSCGCLKEDTKVFDCLTNSKEYSSWYAMHQRCYGTMDDAYPKAGREVCERWDYSPEGFFNFLSDMGVRPEGTTLERVDNEKGYSPDNCKWDIPGNQAFNRKLFKNNKTGKTGVYYVEKSDKWRAKISFEGKIIHLGYFSSYEDACAAREKAEIRFYGRNKE